MVIHGYHEHTHSHSATMPLSGTHSRTPLHRTAGFLLGGRLPNFSRTTWAMLSGEAGMVLGPEALGTCGMSMEDEANF